MKPRLLWNERGEVGDDVYFTLRDGRIVGYSTARRRIRAELRRLMCFRTDIDEVCARTVGTGDWYRPRHGMLVEAVVRDAVDVMLDLHPVGGHAGTGIW